MNWVLTPARTVQGLHQRILTADPSLTPADVAPVLEPEAGVVPRQLPAAVAHLVGRGRKLRPYPVNVNAVRPIRDRVVDLAFTEAHSDNVRRAVRAVQTLQAALRYPAGMFGRAISAEEHASWTPVFVDVLDRLARLASHPGLDPIAAVAVRQAVQWHAQYAAGETSSRQLKPC